MSPQAQRLAIAKACPDLFTVVEFRPGRTLVYWKASFEEVGIEANPVDPLNDLNAMFEVEELLFKMDGFVVNQGVRTTFLDNLLIVCAGGFHAGIHATAAQRLKAALKTLNLWNDSK